MSKNNPITELDFDQLKSDIIAFAKTNPVFTDYNFEGSALNSIIDILAYNTHTNAYYANMLHNEGFLDTAQKRSSVVSRAKELGYTPRSSVCSNAFLDITLFGVSPEITSMTIPRGTNFTSTNDNGTYSFIVSDTNTSIRVGGDQLFKSVRVVNGVRAKNFYTIDTQTNIRSIFTIPNSNIDTSTIKVTVRNSISSLDYVEYFLATNAYGAVSDSTVFFLQESFDGLFQIYFGGDVIGKQPANGNVIDIDYIVNENNELSDGCRTFGFDGSIGAYSNINLLTTQVSFGGAVKEDIASIKYNAVKSNSAKQRSVTTSDYELIIKEAFNFVKSASVWGGEDNVPPVYGKVFISLQPVSGYTISDTVKNNIITPALRANSIMTVGVQYVDPTYINLYFNTAIKFNPTKSILSQDGVEGNVRSAIVNYVTSITAFNKDYLDSSVSALLVSLDPGIVSVDISKIVGFKLTPLLGVRSNHEKYVNNAIVSGSIRSTKFNVVSNLDLVEVSIKEIPNKIENVLSSFGVISTNQFLGLYSDSNTLIEEIGYVNLSSGKFYITFSVYSYITDTHFVSIFCSLSQKDVSTYRNYILTMDSAPEDATIGHIANNEVVTNIYGK